LNKSVETYLKAIAEMAIGQNPVPVTCVAEQLIVSVASTSEMVHRVLSREDFGMSVNLTSKEGRYACKTVE
jgi:Mn-dependent DtxR family transcriptional regulator